MNSQLKLSDPTIRGSCSLYVCRCCRTKFGWAHQKWCALGSVTKPSCADCHYYNENNHQCVHPLNKGEGGETA